MKKSNWREELNAPKAVRKYALNEVALAIPAGVALTKWLLGTLAVGGIGAAGYDYHQKMKGNKGIFPNIFGGTKTNNNIQWRDTSNNNNVNTNKKNGSVPFSTKSNISSTIGTVDNKNLNITRKIPFTTTLNNNQKKVQVPSQNQVTTLDPGSITGTNIKKDKVIPTTKITSAGVVNTPSSSIRPAPEADISTSDSSKDAAASRVGDVGTVVIPKVRDVETVADRRARERERVASQTITKKIAVTKDRALSQSQSAVKSKAITKSKTGKKLPPIRIHGLPLSTKHDVGFRKNPT